METLAQKPLFRMQCYLTKLNTENIPEGWNDDRIEYMLKGFLRMDMIRTDNNQWTPKEFKRWRRFFGTVKSTASEKQINDACVYAVKINKKWGIIDI